MMSLRRSDVSSSSDTPNRVARTASICSLSLLGEDDSVLTGWLDMNVEDIGMLKPQNTCIAPLGPETIERRYCLMPQRQHTLKPIIESCKIP